MSDANLFDEFKPVTAKAWKQKIQADLKGADYHDTLIWESPEGIHIKPFYHSEDTRDIRFPVSRPRKNWFVTEKLFAKDAQKTLQKAKEVVHKGTESLYITVPSEKVAIEPLLSEIDLSTTPIHLDFQFLSLEYLKSVVDFMNNKTGTLYLHLDIIGHLAKSGNWFHSLAEDHAILKEILTYTQTQTGIHVPSVDMGLFQNAGANTVQQLAYGLAQANEYLNFYEGKVAEIPRFVFRTSIGSNYFMEIAKLRALRLLWNTLSGTYPYKNDLFIVAEPSRRNKTLYDYNVNMLRTTTECMSAVLGGADYVCNLAYDSLFHKENGFGERIARNQLLLLKGESYFDKVSNPADGSYYIEGLTHQIADKALKLFKSIEAGGGFLKQLKEHTLQKKIKESADREQALFDTGKEVLVGTNKYLNEEDKMRHQLQINPFRTTERRKTLIAPILERRLAEPMEQKRLEDE